MFTHRTETKTTYATPKTITKGTVKPKKYTLPEIPEGLAPYFQYGQDVDSGLASTICVLVKADGAHNNKLPSTLTKWETVASGIAFQKYGDADNIDLARVVSLGRAIKAYYKNRSNRAPYVTTGTISVGSPVYFVR